MSNCPVPIMTDLDILVRCCYESCETTAQLNSPLVLIVNHEAQGNPVYEAIDSNKIPKDATPEAGVYYNRNTSIAKTKDERIGIFAFTAGYPNEVRDFLFGH